MVWDWISDVTQVLGAHYTEVWHQRLVEGAGNSMVEYVISGSLSTLGVDPSNKKSPCMTLQPEKTTLTCVDNSSWTNQMSRLKPFNLWLELQLE